MYKLGRDLYELRNSAVIPVGNLRAPSSFNFSLQTGFKYVGFLSSGMSSGMMGRNVPNVNMRSISSASDCFQFVAFGPTCDFLYVIVDPSGFRFSGLEGKTGGKHGFGIDASSISGWRRFALSIAGIFEGCANGAATSALAFV